MAKECYDHLGNRYISIVKMCKHYGIRPGTYSVRIKRGYTVKQALGLEKINRIKKFVVEGIGTFDSFKDALEKYNMSSSVYNLHIRMGMTPKEALEYDGKSRNKKQIDIEGYGRFESIKEACNYFGVKETTFFSRVERGMDPVQALTKQVLPKQIEVSIEGHGTFSSIKEACKHMGIGCSTYRGRVKYGIDPLQALILPVLVYKICISHIGIDGKQYYEIKTPDKTYYLNAQQIIEYTDKGIFERKQDDKDVTRDAD